MKRDITAVSAKEQLLRLIDMHASRSTSLASLSEQLRRGDKQVVDQMIYRTRAINGSAVVDMFRDDDVKIPGVGNISKGMNEKGYPFALVGLVLTMGTAAGDTQTEIHSVNYDVIPAPVRNGEFEVKVGDNIVIPSSSLELFDTSNRDIRKGLYVLDSAKLIEDQVALRMEIKLPSAIVAGIPANSYLKIGLIGSSISSK